MTHEIIPGTVYIIGAGPGAPDLITVRGQAIIAAADLVLYADSMVEEDVAQLARKPNARLVATSTIHLDQIVPLMIEAAQAGAVVARVHSGDPALYGATHELTTLEEIDPSAVDMFTLVLVGSSQSFEVAERMVTPRGYAITPAEEVQS